VLINKDRNWYADLPMGDWPLQVELTSHGPLIGIDKNMSVYRSHHGGVWTQKSMLEQLKLCSKFYYSVKKEYYSKITVSFYENLFNHHLNLFILSWENQKYIKSLTNIYSYLVLKGEIQYLSIKQLLCRKLSKKNCKV
jgi:hypothetical protein